MTCPSCGVGLAEHLRFCTACGTRIVEDGLEVRQAETAGELLEGKPLAVIVLEQTPMFWRRAFELLEGLCLTVAETSFEQTLAADQIYVEQQPGQVRRFKLAPLAIRAMRDNDDRQDTAVGWMPNFAKYGISSPFPSEIAPETLMGKPFRPSTHVYNLGVIAYTMLVGVEPFPDAKGPAGLITAQLKQRPQAPSTARRDIPLEVDAVVLRCLEKRPDDRFPNVTALAAAIGSVLRPDRQPHVLDARNRELEDVIAEAPYDSSAYAVYGDWLLQQGDPRGELVALHVQLETAAMDNANSTLADELRGSASAEFAKRASYLLGPLAKYVGPVPDAPVPFSWRFGFIHGVALDSEDCAIDEVLEAVFRHPSGRFVTDLDLAFDRPGEVAAAIETIVRHAPSTLRGLALQSDTDLGDVSPLWPAMPRLRRLMITAPTFELGSLSLSAATHVKIRAGRLSKGAALSIARAPWSRLEQLQIRFGTSEVRLEELSPFLQRRDLTALSKLGLVAWRSAGPLLLQLQSHPVFGSITSLDLSFGNVAEEHVRALEPQLVALPRLREIIVPWDRLAGFHLEQSPTLLRPAARVDELAYLG